MISSTLMLGKAILFGPEDPLAPRQAAFAEAWHAQSLALAHAFIQAGRFTPSKWAEALGFALKEAEAKGIPDTDDSYYHAVLGALERLSVSSVGISRQSLEQRKKDWEAAYNNTPHGKPVLLSAADKVE
jgi:nitrile hydratase accessory protein